MVKGWPSGPDMKCRASSVHNFYAPIACEVAAMPACLAAPHALYSRPGRFNGNSHAVPGIHPLRRTHFASREQAMTNFKAWVA